MIYKDKRHAFCRLKVKCCDFLPVLALSFSAADCCITEIEKTILVFSKEHLYFVCNWCIRENDKIIIFHGADSEAVLVRALE